MAYIYRLSNKCTENYYNWSIYAEVIDKEVVTCFFSETQCVCSNRSSFFTEHVVSI